MSIRKKGLKMQAIRRDSGIEFIKIFAIFIIVISHVAQTLTHENFVMLRIQ